MKQIVVSLLVKDGNLDYVFDNIRICEKLGIDSCVFDYRLDKSIPIVADNVIQRPFEEWNSYRSEIVEFLSEGQYKAFVALHESTKLTEGWIEKIDLSLFEDENIGSVYSDFYLSTDSYEIPLMNTSMPSAHNSFPFIAFSSKAYCSKLLESDNPESAVLSSLISIHIPEFLCVLSNV